MLTVTTPPGLFPQLCRGLLGHCRARKGTHLGHEDLFLQLGRGMDRRAPGVSQEPGQARRCSVVLSARRTRNPRGTAPSHLQAVGLAQCEGRLSSPGPNLSLARLLLPPAALLPGTEQVGHPGTASQRAPAAADAHGQHSLPGAKELLTASHGLSHSGPQLRTPSSEGLGGNKTAFLAPDLLSF